MTFTSVDMKVVLCRTLLIPALLLPGQVLAQAAGLEEITVTAQKREESLQDATISVTALKGEDIGSYGIRDMNHLQTQMPGVQFMTSGLTNTVIRGVGTYNNQPNVDAAVAWNIDGTYISHHMATPPILFDIDRVEVVRGPLGTLYGKNSNGGAININTSRPILGEWHGRASIGVGNYDQVDSEAMLNIPITDVMALRLAFANDYSDGYFEDGGEGTNNYAARARLLIEPSENFDLLATIEWSNVDGSGVGIGFCPPTVEGVIPACDGVEWKPYQGLGQPGNFIANGTDGPIGENPGFTQRENWSTYVEWNYSWDFATLTSITNWHKYDRLEQHTWDFNSYQPKHKNEFFTQEMRLANGDDSPFDWVVGFFYSNEQSDGTESFGTTVGPEFDQFVMNNYYGVVGGEVVTEAGFGDVSIPIAAFDDKLRIKGGLRYTHERKSLPGEAGTNFLPGPPDPVIVETGSTLKNSKLTWSAGLEYDITDDNMVYFKVNTGFKSGTVNQIPPTVTAVAAVTDPEEVIAYQIGSKNYFFDGRLSVNAEAFHYDYEGYQTVVIETDPSGFFPGIFFPSVNAQKAKYWGAEIESSYAIWENGQLDLALTLLDAEHKEFVTRTFDFSGHDVQRSPDFTIMAGYQHEWTLPNDGTLRGRVSTMYVDTNYSRDPNLPGDVQGDYTNTSMYLSYLHPGGNWSLTGWVRNLEDKDVIGVSQGTAGRPGWNVFMLPPRMWGFTLKYEM